MIRALKIFRGTYYMGKNIHAALIAESIYLPKLFQPKTVFFFIYAEIRQALIDAGKMLDFSQEDTEAPMV
ncbi:hypothetical protein CT690_21135 [Serratia plymuthica]|uniref:Uncharacterized protein n=2 Tax=Serratia plymuthica TaxID=82996 RepID=A0A318NT31_SERPL|nr:hypothetical protein CT690_21135 [Serratia plymuthica]